MTEATANVLMAVVFEARNALAAAENDKRRSERELMQWMQENATSSVKSDELHITATVARRRSAKLADEQACALALNEIGLVIPVVQVPAVEAHEVVDTNELLAIADRYGGDFPGVEVSETEYLTVRGAKS